MSHQDQNLPPPAYRQESQRIRRDERDIHPPGPSGSDVLRIIAAIILPPLGVYLQVGLTAQFWVNVVLTILGYVPGIIHAVWIIARR